MNYIQLGNTLHTNNMFIFICIAYIILQFKKE